MKAKQVFQALNRISPAAAIVFAQICGDPEMEITSFGFDPTTGSGGGSGFVQINQDLQHVQTDK